MKALIIGKSGQLAWELQRTAPQGWDVVALASSELDISDQDAVHEQLRALAPAIVLNCAAYTAVDKAESEFDRADAINHLGARYLAQACRDIGARLLHVSTDFVFDGGKTTPYQVNDRTNPLGVYGATKLAGERAVEEVLGGEAVIVRTAWVYSAHGANFVKTMLRLMAEKPQLGVVYDQVGTPTWAKGLAEWLWAVASLPEVKGTFHWTDAGVASWYDFAVAIQDLAVAKGLLPQAIPIKPIPATAYPTPAKRPSFSVLDKTQAEQAANLQNVHWRQQLSSMLDELL